jgi:ATP-dependent exoDNAse (exonuclease V) beta subunit
MAQIDVFSRLFCHRNTLSFIVIGDPKQSIYRFRGADLASYTHLAASVEGAPAMTTNHRSDPGLIGALNTLYGGDYVFPNTVSDTQQHAPTSYIPVTAKAAGARIWDPKISKPVVFQWCGEEDRSSAMSAIASHLAEECARLLADKVEIEDKKTRRRRLLEPGDGHGHHRRPGQPAGRPLRGRRPATTRRCRTGEWKRERERERRGW